MNILAIVIADSIGIFLALSVLNISYMDRRGNDPDSRLLTALLVISFSCCLMEMVSFLVDGKASGICVAMVWITNHGSIWGIHCSLRCGSSMWIITCTRRKNG